MSKLLKKYSVYSILMIISLIVILLLFIKPNKSNYDKARVIIGRKLPIQDTLGKPYGIVFIKNKIIIFDKMPVTDNKKIRSYDPKYYQLLTSFGRSGSGPGEFQAIETIDRVIKNKNQITVMDFNLRRLSVIDISNNKTMQLNNVFSLREGTPYCPVLVDDTTIASIGLTLLKGRYALYDTTGKIESNYGEILEGKKSGTPMPVHQQAMLGRLKITPDGTKIVITAHLSDIIDIYSRTGKLLNRITGPLNIIQ